MIRRLILMRHARSDWDVPEADHDRPLNERGRASALAVGDWLRREGHIPDQVLVSSARRTIETCARLILPVPPQPLRRLYLAGPDILMEELRQATGDCVLMLAHNPGIAEFAARLVTDPPDHPRFLDFPTCATLVADFTAASWRDIGYGTGRALDFITPRELADLPPGQ